MDREHWKAGLASAVGFFLGLVVPSLAAALFLRRGTFDALSLTALLLPAPPLAAWLCARQANRWGLARCWFPGNVAAGTTLAFMLAAPFSVTAAVAVVIRRGAYGDWSFLSMVLGLTGLAMLTGGALAAVPEKPCVGRILLYGTLATAFILLAWTALSA